MSLVSHLDAYFERIGYRGPREPTLATLNGVMAAHVESIPFENLDVLLGKPILIDEAALVRKLIHERRGGYCFEQNGLFLGVLEALGYQVTPISARVRLQRPRDYIPPRTHLFARVELEGESWLADVGVGGLSLTGALRLDTEAEQATPHEPRRIVREGRLLFHQAKLGTEWADVCEFTLEEMPPIDRELANWYTSAHPHSHFKSRLLVARAGPAGTRISLLNREFTWRGADGRADTRPVETAEQLQQLLEEHFGLRFPPGTRFGGPGMAWPT